MQRRPAVKQRHPLGRVIADNFKNGQGQIIIVVIIVGVEQTAAPTTSAACTF
jgi:hypothetical protein